MAIHDEIRRMSDEKSINESFSVRIKSVDERAGCPLRSLAGVAIRVAALERMDFGRRERYLPDGIQRILSTGWCPDRWSTASISGAGGCHCSRFCCLKIVAMLGRYFQSITLLNLNLIIIFRNKLKAHSSWLPEGSFRSGALSIDAPLKRSIYVSECIPEQFELKLLLKQRILCTEHPEIYESKSGFINKIATRSIER